MSKDFDKNCLICTKEPIGMSPTGLAELKNWHTKGHLKTITTVTDLVATDSEPEQTNTKSAQSTNLDQEIEDLTAKIYYRVPIQYLDVPRTEATQAIKELIDQKVKEARIEAVKELKRRWDKDRKTMDYSPDTYMFICDKYIQELEK